MKKLSVWIAMFIIGILFWIFAVKCFAQERDNSVITKIEKGDTEQKVKITSERQDNKDIKVTLTRELPLKIIIQQKAQLQEQKIKIEAQIEELDNVINEAKAKGVKE